MFKRKTQVEALFAGAAGPVTGYDRAKREFFEIYGTSQASAARWFIVATVLGLALVALALTINRLLPLKTVVPYIVKVSDDGAVKETPVVASHFTPDRNMRAYFLRQWTERTFTTDQYTSLANMQAAQAVVRSTAVGEFQKLLKDDDPFGKLSTDRQYTRVVHISSVDPGADNIGFVYFSTEERSGSAEPRVKRYRLTIHYAIAAPTTEQEIASNPIGLYVTHFARTEDL